MRTTFLLFGLAACAATPAARSTTAHHPLCDVDGAPACGNVGQVGRASATPARIANDMPPRARATTKPTATPSSPTQVLVGMSSAITPPVVVARPLMDRNEVACGNVMSKRGPSRICHDGSGNVVSESDVDGEDE